MQETNRNGEVPTQATLTGRVEAILMPAPTAWPMALALAIGLMFGGMLTHWALSLLGLIVAVLSVIGWFYQVFPYEHHLTVSAETAVTHISSNRSTEHHQELDANHRRILPIETFRISSGIKGGLFGGLAMILPAAVFGLIRYHSIWYAMNLLAAGGFVSWAGADDAFFAQFHLQGLLAAIAIHSLTSVLIGLLYGAMLPMFPKKPILTAGFVAPFLWTGILYSALGIISPILNARIDWPWFIASQIAFGLVCGYVVNLQARVRTPQFRALPFSIRAGIHSDQSDKKDDIQ